MNTIKVLCVHGLGDHRTSPWMDNWKATILAAFPRQDEVQLQFEFLTYDDIFEDIEISLLDSAKALGKLIGSSIGIRGARERGIGDVRDKLRWTAGYVVAWVESDEFRELTDALVIEAIEKHKPDVIIAHSLGTLITYNVLASAKSPEPALARLLKNITYVTMGSQIANRFVVGCLTKGRIEPLPVKQWTQLYNEEDDVFTARIRLVAQNFEVIDTFFDIDGFADHDATYYLKHPATIGGLYNRLAREASTARLSRAVAPALRKLEAKSAKLSSRPPRRRALLIGINDYPDPKDRLEGCVNDTYLLSAALQECSFKSEDIRLCLDKRATRKGILERMEWLIEDARPGDELFFAYSGHGTQLAAYGPEEVVDHKDETLCPWDFAWTPETCITDDEIFQYYGQLPYDTRFVMVFDCCHSGGIHREGAGRVRGLTPPDDIRHRELRWDTPTQTWVQRELDPVLPSFSSKPDIMKGFAGASRTVNRLGRGSSVRHLTEEEYKGERKKSKIVGPYLPLILEACDEHQTASEYRHGAVSYGAFTWSLCAALRQSTKPTFKSLLEDVRARLRKQGYEQVPQIVGPTIVKNAGVPWAGARPAPKPKPRAAVKKRATKPGKR